MPAQSVELCWQMQAFHEWLQAELDKREWSQAEFSRQSGIDTGTISNVLNDVRKPGPEFCRDAARGLKVPQRVVFVAAGLMDDDDPNDGDISPSLWEAINLLRQLPEEERDREIAALRIRAKRPRGRHAPGNATS